MLILQTLFLLVLPFMIGAIDVFLIFYFLGVVWEGRSLCRYFFPGALALQRFVRCRRCSFGLRLVHVVDEPDA